MLLSTVILPWTDSQDDPLRHRDSVSAGLFEDTEITHFFLWGGWTEDDPVAARELFAGTTATRRPNRRTFGEPPR